MLFREDCVIFFRRWWKTKLSSHRTLILFFLFFPSVIFFSLPDGGKRFLRSAPFTFHDIPHPPHRAVITINHFAFKENRSMTSRKLYS